MARVIFCVLSTIWCLVSDVRTFSLNFMLREELPEGTLVGTVSNASGFSQLIPSEDLHHLHFNYLIQSKFNSLFIIHETTGAIRTQVVVDRESPETCPSQGSCSLMSDIAVTSTRPQSPLFEIVTVHIAILDINDNVPTFPANTVQIVIPEGTAVGTTYHIDSAEDRDLGKNSIQSYEISPVNDKFELQVTKRLDNSSTVHIAIKGPLDREEKDLYQVRVLAKDGGDPPQIGSVAVNISILDKNDNKPVFLRDSYNLSLRENTTIGTTIVRVTASDDDAGLNGYVVYQFSPSQPGIREIQRMFSIDRDTGEIKLIEKLVYEEGKVYEIIVEANDLGEQTSVAQAIVTIAVVDVGNNAPQVQINLLPGGANAVNISEWTTPGTFVAHVQVTDKDTGKNGEVFCEVDDPLFSLQVLPGRGYKVTVQGQLDREVKDKHYITVSCHDNGMPSLTSSASFVVEVEDENDKAPVFIHKFYYGSVEENVEGVTFLTVSATDLDLEDNGEVLYFIDTTSTIYDFNIDSLTGEVSTGQSFDRENVTEVSFTVLAVDNGKIPLSGNATVTVKILDVNDNAPVFKEDPVRFKVRENLPYQSLVDRLNASDADEGNNSKIIYSMRLDFEYEVPFEIYLDGRIKTTTQLDREVKDIYRFIVVAFDCGSPAQTTEVEVIIAVADDNDFWPEIRFPKDKNSSVIVPGTARPGTVIAKVDAFDRDIGENGDLTFQITHGNEAEYFLIDSKRGDIYLTKTYISKVHSNRTFSLLLAIQDGGAPQFSKTAKLNITLMTANETAMIVPEGETVNNNIVIVGIVVAVTAVLSTLMILLICIIRRKEKPTKVVKQGGVMVLTENGSSLNYSDDRGDSGNTSSTFDSFMLPKKKEVSFDLDVTLDGAGSDFDPSFTVTNTRPEHLQASPELERSPRQGRQLSHLQMLQYHQAMLESQTRAWLHSQECHKTLGQTELSHIPEDDVTSDASGEVTNSDSGKGGSEEDFAEHHHVRGPAGTHSTGAVHQYPHMSSKSSFKDFTFPKHNQSYNQSHSSYDSATGSFDDMNSSQHFFNHSTPNGAAAMFYSQHEQPRNVPVKLDPDCGDWDPAYV